MDNLLNKLIINGSENDIGDILNYVAIDCEDESPLVGTMDFNKIIPMPDDIDEPEQQIQWMLSNWNTDTNAICEHDYQSNKDNEVSFLTNQTIPFPVIAKLSRKFPDTEFVLKVSDVNEINVTEFEYIDGNCLGIISNGYKFAEMFYP